MPRRKSNTAKGLRCEEVAMALAGDRRKRKRVLLHWPVRLLRQPGTSPIDTTTENISSEGLYCISNESFKPGERVQCMRGVKVPGRTEIKVEGLDLVPLRTRDRHLRPRPHP